MGHFAGVSWWSHVEAGPPDLMLKIGEAYARDPSSEKADLSAGIYRDENGEPWVLPCVRQAEEKLAAKNLHKEYLPIAGDADFCLNSVKITLGDDSKLIAQGKVAAVQGVAGIGALRVLLEYFTRFHRGINEMWVSDPCYAAHEPVLEHLGPVRKHRYYNRATKSFDYEGMLEDISNIPEGSIILLQPSAHNPTGVDPTLEQWAGISKAIKKARIFPVFDTAHQGLASGDLETDALPVRLFVRDDHQFALVQTYSKIMGLYGERAGSIALVTADEEETARVTSQLKIIIRTMYSCPPINGVRIANEVFSDPELKKQWIKDLKTMTNRMNLVRKELKKQLDKTGSKLNWDHIAKQVGMVCFTGLNPEQVKKMREEYSVYASTDGRISIGGVNSKNAKLVAKALHGATNVSWWSHVEAGPSDLMLKIGEAYARDPNTEKVDLSAGVYRDEKGEPWVLPCVRQAEKKIAAKKLHKEYLPIDGYADFCYNSVRIVLGDNSKLLAQGRVAVIQGVAGIGALRVWLEYFARFHKGENQVWISDPSYAAHEPILEHLGPVRKHRYYNRATKNFDYEGMLEDISNMPEGSIILLHPCAHNPSGVDPTPEQWAGISRAIKDGRIFPLFDMAYHGLSSGDLEKDATSIKLFARDGHHFALVQTYSKTLGLYGERVGSLALVTANPEETTRVTSQLKIIARTMYSCPPVNGVRIANEVFNDLKLTDQWIEDLKTMTNRMNFIRKELKKHLDKTGSKLNWNHVTDQVGMFCFTGLSSEQVKRMREEFSVYASTDGRISIAGVNSDNVERVARALHGVTK